MSVFKRRLSFRMLYFVKNILKLLYNEGFGLEALQASLVSWGSPSGGSEGKSPSFFKCGG